MIQYTCKKDKGKGFSKMTIDQIREESTYFALTHDMYAGICALVDGENMGFCKDGVTRYYHFTNADGQPAGYFKY